VDSGESLLRPRPRARTSILRFLRTFLLLCPLVATTNADIRDYRPHSAFLSHLALLAPNPTTAFPAARAAIRSFRAFDRAHLISTLWSVLGVGTDPRHMEAVASMVNTLVDFFDEGEQSEVVLSAWRGFEIEVRDVPAVEYDILTGVWVCSSTASSPSSSPPRWAPATRGSRAGTS
jgi:hypothetical protein